MMKSIKFVVIGITLLFTVAPLFSVVQASSSDQTENLYGIVTEVLEERDIVEEGETRKYQKLEILITKGSIKDRKIIVENGVFAMTQINEYKVKDKIILSYSIDSNDIESFYITDYVRIEGMFILLGLFIALALFIAQKRGFYSLISLIASFVIIYWIILPQIGAGHDPVLITIFGSLVIIPITFYLSHGLNKKTTVSIFGTTISLIITGLLSGFFVQLTHLTGLSSDEAMYLQLTNDIAYDLQGLLMAGIIIGTLGVLDDVTVSQTSIVYQLFDLDSSLTFRELYKRSIDIGKDHISSMINTLVLVYTGASMPLLLLFMNNPMPFFDIVNYEYVAIEIIRTLVGSIGLIIAVPITTLLACYFVTKKK